MTRIDHTFDGHFKQSDIAKKKEKLICVTCSLTDRLGGKEAWRPIHFS